MNVYRLVITSLAILALTLFCVLASAAGQYPPFGGPEGMPPRHERPSPKEEAERRTDEMDKAVNLDRKQYRKIYRIFLKEENAKASAFENGGPMGPPPGGFPGGPGMGGGFDGGFHGGGFPGSFPGGFPGGGGPDFGEPQKPAVGGKELGSDEYLDYREEKFRKILTAEQYTAWRKFRPGHEDFFMMEL